VKSVPADNNLSIVDPPASASGAYPISTFTYVIVPTKSSKASELRNFITWAIGSTGQSFGPKLDFAPLPSKVVAAGEATLKKLS
jgi:ABC-type phosphate transport system substrate-binding protein